MKPHYLRHALVVLAALIVIFAFVNVISGGRSLIGAGVVAAVIVVLLTVEARRYKPNVDRDSSVWHETGESFIDPSSGDHVRVFFNPETGQRDYRHTR